MSTPKRTQDDIKRIVVSAEEAGIHGWVVDLQYKGGKRASFSIDYGKDGSDDMLELVHASIKKQLTGTDSESS